MDDEWTQPVTVEEMYGEWDYEAAVEALNRSLNPRRGTALFDTVASVGVGDRDVVLDIGGREGRDALAMAERFGSRAVCVDPVAANLERGAGIVADHEFAHLVELRLGSIEHIPAVDGEFTLIYSRDMLGHIEDLDVALAECARVLRPVGHMVIHEVFGTSLLEPQEEALVCDYTATVPERLSVPAFEATVAASALSVESVDVVGSEFTEANQEAGKVPNYLLQVSRLRRAKEQLVAELGEVPYRVMYGNALWSIYRLIGKLETRVYVLRRSGE
jgi:SAM-dependent methyltransferase